MPLERHPSLSLASLLANPTKLNIRKLWRALQTDIRERAIVSLLHDKPKGHTLRRNLVGEIARARHFRPQTVRQWSDEKLATSGARIEIRDHELMASAIIAFHVKERAPLMAEFLSHAGVPHENGLLKAGQEPRAAIDAGRLGAAAESLLAAYAVDEAVAYLLAVRILYPLPFGGLDAWFGALAVAGQAEPQPNVFQSLPQDESLPSTSDVDTFTTLDHRLILVIVDAAAGTEGAPTTDALDDLLLEVQALNSGRHRTFFHLGLRDALFAHSPNEELPAENRARREWYWAGYISGLARTSKYDSICEIFDLDSVVKDFGNSASPQAGLATILVFRALNERGRHSEAFAFLGTPAIATSGELRVAAFRRARALVREGRAAEARPMLDLLWKHYESDKVAAADHLRTLLQRERALCLRQLGDATEAKVLLSGLLAADDPLLRSVARTDIGLIEAGFRRLGDMTLPRSESDVPTFIERLSRGESHF